VKVNIKILTKVKEFTFLFSFILSFIQIPNSFAQTYLEEAMLVPINFINIEDSGIQKSIDNFIRAELSKNYFLKSRDEVLEAIEKAADDADSSNCTDEACIKIMEELLDVQYTFVFEITSTSDGWDISAKRLKYDDVTTRLNDLCKRCDLSKARAILKEMISNLLPGSSTLSKGKAVIQLRSQPKATVYINAVEVGTTPIDAFVPSGEVFDVLAVAIDDGYSDFIREYPPLSPGQTIIESFRLSRLKGKVFIESDPPGAKIQIDGKSQKSRDGSPLVTPQRMRLSYGEYELTLTKKHHQKFMTVLKVNQEEQRGSFSLIPLPAKLLIRAPDQHKNATVFLNGIDSGEMGGKIKSFNVEPFKEISVQLKDDVAQSEIKSIQIGAGQSKSIVFKSFEIQLVELRITVPRGFNYSNIEVNDEFIGSMNGSTLKIFEVPFKKEFKIKGIQGKRESTITEIKVTKSNMVNLNFPEPLINLDKFDSVRSPHNIAITTQGFSITLKSPSNNFISNTFVGGFQYEYAFYVYDYGIFEGTQRIFLNYLTGNGTIEKDTTGSAYESSPSDFYIFHNGKTYHVKGYSLTLFQLGAMPSHGKNSGFYYSVAGEIGSLKYKTNPSSNMELNFYSIVFPWGYRWDYESGYFTLGFLPRFSGTSDTTSLSGGLTATYGIVF